MSTFKLITMDQYVRMFSNPGPEALYGSVLLVMEQGLSPGDTSFKVWLKKATDWFHEAQKLKAQGGDPDSLDHEGRDDWRGSEFLGDQMEAIESTAQAIRDGNVQDAMPPWMKNATKEEQTTQARVDLLALCTGLMNERRDS